MTAVFTDFFRAQLFANQAAMSNANIRVHYFAVAPSLNDNDPRVTGIQTLSDLAGQAGWGQPLTPTVTQTVGTLTTGGSTFVISNNPFHNQPGWVESNVVAAAFVYVGTGLGGGETDPVIFITTTPFGGTTIADDDSLIALPNTALANNRAVFQWVVPPVGAPQLFPSEGPLFVYKAPPSFESSHQQHLWLYPQRVNLVANPSFEGGTNHWRTSGTPSRLNTAAPGGGAWSGQFTGAAPVAAESNLFPLSFATSVGDYWTIQAMVRGNGRLKVGLVSWEPDFLQTRVDWGEDESWELQAGAFTRVWAMRRAGETTTGLVRLETNGTVLIADNVLAEPDWLRDWPYFDGDTTYGARDDFSWYGGENRKGETYSLWYNHRNAVIGRMFAWSIPDDDFTVTDDEVEKQGFVYGWVPAGVRVTPHLDVLYPGDIRAPVPDVAGSPVTPGISPF
jgi:hypothetical protein